MNKFKRFNNKGFYALTTVTSIFIIASIIIFLVMPRLYHVVSVSKESQTIIQETIKQRNKDERISSLIKNDPSFVGTLNYDEGYESIIITEISSTYEVIDMNSVLVDRTISVEDDKGKRNLYFDFR